MIANNVEPSFIGKIGVPCCLIEISMRECKRLESNSNNVIGIYFEKHGDGSNHAVYNHVKLGYNVKLT